MGYEMNLYLKLRHKFIEGCFVSKVDRFYHLEIIPYVISTL
jgi:hypothetical protein